MTELTERVARLETNIENFRGLQEKQNNCLLRLEGKVESLYKIMIGILGSAVTSLIVLVINLVIKN